MGNFEIVYSANGGPPALWKGENAQVPPDLLDVSESPSSVNFFFRNAELRSRPPWVSVFKAPESTNPVLGVGSFLDANNVTHSFAFTSNGLYQLKPTNNVPGDNPWFFIGLPQLTVGVPVAWQAFVNKLFYTNGSPQVVQWDGIANAPVIVSYLADGVSTVGGLFLFELASHLVLAYVVQQNSNGIVRSAITAGGTGYNVGDTGTVGTGLATYQITKVSSGVVTGFTITNSGNGYVVAAGTSTTATTGSGTGFTINIEAVGTMIQTQPQALWWSASGLPNVWDPSVNVSAGFNLLLDTPDIITGAMALGAFALIFRQNGITQMTPTGNGIEPFQFDHLWASQKGIGNVFPFSISQYGSIGMFISTEQIFQVSVNSFFEIGGGERDNIMRDLALATGNPVANINPTYGTGYVFLSYVISIPLGTLTRHYVYSIEDKNWCHWDTPLYLATAKPNYVWR